MTRTVGVCVYPRLPQPRSGWASVAVDVIRATSTAVTAVAAGRRCFPAASLEAALQLADRLEDPLLVGELGGNMPFGFHLQNSPAEMNRRVDLNRPVILLSTTGTRLLAEAAEIGVTYAACLRNVRAQSEHLIARHDRVILLAGESRGEFREEDRLCCGRLAHDLLDAGYEPQTPFVEELATQWGSAPADAFLRGHSVQYLESTGQHHDVEFILEHVDDLDSVFVMSGGELLQGPVDAPREPRARPG